MTINLSVMPKPNYSAMLAELNDELDGLIGERNRLQKKLDAILDAIEAVKTVAEESDQVIVQPTTLADDAGFTEKVRELLFVNSAKSFTALEIREVFLEVDKNADPKIMLIHIHNTVKRLHKQGELEEVDRLDGKGYRWASVTAKSRMAQIKAHVPHGFVPMNTPADGLKKK